MTIPFAFNSSTHGHRASARLAGLLSAFALLVLFSTSAFAQYGGPTKLTIKSKVLGEDRAILVRTPAAYDTNKQTYPVLYMTDGDAHINHTSGSLEFLARNGRMSEMIVVGIPNTDRTRDLSPTKPSNAGATGGPQFPTAGGADNFLKFIETELIPEIEKTYRTQPYRVLAGHSLGGLFAVHAMITKPDLFNSYIAVSPALNWDNQIEVKRAEDFLKTRKEFNAVFYMSLGNEPGLEDSYHQMKQLLARNQVKGFEWQAQEMDDEDHGSVVLRSHYFALRKIYDGWQMPRDPMTGQVAGGIKAIDAHYQKLSDKFHYKILPPEALINQAGYQHLFADQNDEAIAVFKLQVERYPDSANVYDSLAEAYEKIGRLDLATPLYEKAAAIGKQNNDANAAVFARNYARSSEKLKAATAKKTEAGSADAKKNE